MGFSLCAQTLTNLSTQVNSLSASAESEDHLLSRINDNVTSNKYYWSGYHGDSYFGQYEWVEMGWKSNNSFTQIQAYWATDDENILVPDSAYVMRWDGHKWVEVCKLNEASTSNVSTTDVDFTTNRIRVYMKSAKSVGLRELRMRGYAGESCTAAQLTDATTRGLVPGETLTLAPKLTLPSGEEESPIWNWSMPDGTTAITASVEATQVGVYTVSYQRSCGAVTTLTYNVIDPTVDYKWKDHPYNPTLNYNFSWEYPALPAPSKGPLPEDVNQSGWKADGWWAFAWGPNKNKYVTDTAIDGLLAKMNEDFAFFRDEFGWPPDKRARNGYYSQVYLYGSGLYTDNASISDRGGWQSGTSYLGEGWPMVLLSYYPVACFDPAFTRDSYYDNEYVADPVGQQNACVHEGIHATFADLEGCKNSAWFHEGGNTWLQGEAELVKSGTTPTSMGFLSAGNMIAPFMPIECYSGWLQDDTFGGPSAEGVNLYNGSQQICTWRNLLGGVQYGELFPHFLSEIMGRGSIPWIWRYCKNRVLEGMADSLGDKQIRHLIMEYRARQALIDVGQWSTACRALLNNNWLVSVKPEWSPYKINCAEWIATPYANMYKCNEVDSAGWWRPEWRTTPGWSGANQIPLHVNGVKGNIIKIHFKPLGKNMVCQLAYRGKRGKAHYSQPIEGEGDVIMKLEEVPANNVVIAVVTNTDYKYLGEATRSAHYDYRLKMGDNVYQPAKAQLKWYEYGSNIRDTEFITGIPSVETATPSASTFGIIPAATVVKAGEPLPISLRGASAFQVPVRLYSANGQAVCQQSFMRDGNFLIPASAKPGVYMLQAVNGKEKATVKIIVKK